MRSVGWPRKKTALQYWHLQAQALTQTASRAQDGRRLVGGGGAAVGSEQAAHFGHDGAVRLRALRSSLHGPITVNVLKQVVHLRGQEARPRLGGRHPRVCMTLSPRALRPRGTKTQPRCAKSK